MKYSKPIGITLLCAISAVAAFLAGAAKKTTPAPPQNPVTEILQLSENQTLNIQKDDPKFQDESKTLAQTLETERAKLLELLQSPDAPADSINAQLDRTLLANAALERRVVNHLLIMRQHLNETQSQQLMKMCNECMCSNKGAGMGAGHGPMYRGGRNATPAPASPEHPH